MRGPDRFRAALRLGPILMDAAMGTRLIARGLDLASDRPALWALTRPEAVAEVHRLDVEAGADALLTDTFLADRESLRSFGLAPRRVELLRGAVALARSAAGPGRFVVGDIGPSTSSDPLVYREQAETLADSGVDALLLETFTPDVAEAALRQVAGRVNLPVLVSLIAGPSPLPGSLASRLADLGAAAVGINCTAGVAPLVPLLERLRRGSDIPLLARPGAGLPGGPLDPPSAFAATVPRLLDLGVIVFGGCCGTTEAHVAAMRAALDRRPRERRGVAHDW